MKSKIYYHVIEDCGYGKIGSHGYYATNEEAQKQADRLQEMFERNFFYVHPSPSKREPEFITI
jgi:hypothetical protein